jgi:hypothetical protein
MTLRDVLLISAVLPWFAVMACSSGAPARCDGGRSASVDTRNDTALAEASTDRQAPDLAAEGPSWDAPTEAPTEADGGRYDAVPEPRRDGPPAIDVGTAETHDGRVEQVGGCAVSPSLCDDRDPCTKDVCDTSTGKCAHPAAPDGTACDDATVCNGREVCASGACVKGTAPTCNDQSACTTDSCDPVAGCRYAPVADGTSCADANLCNGAETCRAGACVQGAAPSCDDRNPCTTDACAAATGCTHVAVADATPCADSNPCNGVETCRAGTCAAGTPPSCDDYNVCTVDSCAPAGCQHVPLPDETLRPDGTVCNGVEVCYKGVLYQGSPLRCDDGNVCTTDSCDPAAGCQYAPVATKPEVCGDGLDNDCNGRFDEGCACAGVGPGPGGSMPIPSTVWKLVPDPKHCRVYALDRATPSQVIVIDANARTELARVPLPDYGTDLDVSPNGEWIAASVSGTAQTSTPKIVRVDPTTFATTAYAIGSTTFVEVSDAGAAYFHGTSAFIRMDLHDGTTTAGPYHPASRPDLELSEDGKTLYSQETGSTGHIARWDVSSAVAPVSLDGLPYYLLPGFQYPSSPMLLPPTGQALYASHYQLDRLNLAHVSGSTRRRERYYAGGPLFAQDRANTFVVGSGALYDVHLLHPIAPLPRIAEAATLMAADKELWYASGGRLYYVNAPQFLVGAKLDGTRAVSPLEPTSAHDLTHVIVDSKRNRLYGLDVIDSLLVALDGTTLQPIAELRVNSGPSDIDMDRAETHLYVAHKDNTTFLRVDPDTFTVDQSLWVEGQIDSIRARLADARRFLATNFTANKGETTLRDIATGAPLATLGPLMWGGLAVAGDGVTGFMGQADITSGQLYSFKVDDIYLRPGQRSTYMGGTGFYLPRPTIAVTPDATNVYYGGFSLDGRDPRVLNYRVDDPVWAVSPNGRFAASDLHVYRTSDGTVLLSLPPPPESSTGRRGIAFTPDSKRLVLFPPYAPLVTYDVSGF